MIDESQERKEEDIELALIDIQEEQTPRTEVAPHHSFV